MSAHAFAPNFKYSTLAEAAEVTPVGSSKNDEGNYTVSLREDWCIGVIPHGGYLTTILLNASSKYLFGLTSSAHNPRQPQPDPIHISISFATRCTAGHAQISVAPIKLGRQYSFFRVVLSQRNRRCLEAAVIAADVTAEVGKTLRTQPLWFSIPNRETECSPPVGGDHDPTTKWRVAQKKLLYAFPLEISGKPTVPSVKGQWVKLADGSGNQFRVEDLGFVADMVWFSSARPSPPFFKKKCLQSLWTGVVDMGMVFSFVHCRRIIKMLLVSIGMPRYRSR
jgi:hypothetical protein